jgi:PAS domain S-box-containing protein
MSNKSTFLSADLTRQLLDSAPDATVIIDQHGTIVFANTQTEKLFGHLPEELVGMAVELLMPVRYRNNHPGHRQSFFTDSRFRPMGTNLELWGLRKDGSEFPVEISLSPVKTDDELIVCAAIRDITGQHQAQQALLAAKHEADRANRAKSAFLATASHDLRQPLQTLNLLNAVLGKSVKDEDTLNIVENQQLALNMMSDLLNSLLDISKLESGSIVPDIGDCSVQAIFQNLRAQFEAQAQAKGLKLVVGDCKEVVHSDSVLLTQLIQNLVANAIRYTNEGVVQLRCLHDPAALRIEVMDTGIGIPADHANDIFEEFYQVRHDNGERNEGLGLGLAIAQRLSKLLDHPLDFHSKPGEGSSFSIMVPLGKKENVVQKVSRNRDLAGSVAGKKIALVDDLLPVLNATRRLLQREGYEVICATSIDDIISRLQETEDIPDLIVSDFHLGGGKTGVDVVQAVRQLINKPVPVIFLTGDTSSVIAGVPDSLDKCEMMSKPIEVEAMLALIRKMSN